MKGFIPILRRYSREKIDFHFAGTGADVVAAESSFAPITIDNIMSKEQMMFVDTRDGGKQKVFLNAFTVGDFAMISAPFEIFDTNAMYIRENSPYKMTFYASCISGSNQYLSTAECFDWRFSYEAFGSLGAKGAAEAVQDEQFVILNELFGPERTPTEKPEGYIRIEYDRKATDTPTPSTRIVTAVWR